MPGRFTRNTLIGATIALALAGCGSSGGSVDAAARTRVLDALTAIDKSTDYDLSYSITEQDHSSSEQASTVACLSLTQSRPSADGDRLDITNWGSSAVLDGSGGCMGGGTDAREGFLYDGIAYLPTGTAPKGTIACVSSYRRLRITPQATAAMRAQVKHSTGPNLRALVAAARSISSTGDTVTIDVDPARVSTAPTSSSATRPDHETMTVTFTGSSVSAITVELDSGDQTLISTENYTSPATSPVTPPDNACLLPGLGVLTDPTQFSAALGLH